MLHPHRLETCSILVWEPGQPAPSHTRSTVMASQLAKECFLAGMISLPGSCITATEWTEPERRPPLWLRALTTLFRATRVW